jgi:ABC-type molybdate transport system substrate-binding protein
MMGRREGYFMTRKWNSIQIYCAGSLREVMLEIGDRFQKEYGSEIKVTAGPSGMLRERIETGDRPDVFASADLDHPRKLTASGLAGPTVMFVRNQLCVINKAELELTEGNLLDKLLDPSLRLGTSEPIADPGGDYAWTVFRKADEIRPGSFQKLASKAKVFTRGPGFPPAKPGALSLIDAFKNNDVDIYIAYRTIAKTLLAKVSGLAMTELPPALAVEASFGLTLVKEACSEAGYVVLYLLAPEGQKVLVDYGFIPVY